MGCIFIYSCLHTAGTIAFKINQSAIREIHVSSHPIRFIEVSFFCSVLAIRRSSLPRKRARERFLKKLWLHKKRNDVIRKSKEHIYSRFLVGILSGWQIFASGLYSMIYHYYQHLGGPQQYNWNFTAKHTNSPWPVHWENNALTI